MPVARARAARSGRARQGAYAARNGYLARDEQQGSATAARARRASTADARRPLLSRDSRPPPPAPAGRQSALPGSCRLVADDSARVCRHAAAEPRHAVLQLVAPPARGSSRQPRCMHDDKGRIRSRSAPALDACRLAFTPGSAARSSQPRQSAELFLDEVTALAAGHRPCAPAVAPTTCASADGPSSSSWLRPEPTRSTSSCTASASGAGVADATSPPGNRSDGLPDGAFVLRDGEPWLARGSELALLGHPRATPSASARPRGRRGDRDRTALSGGRAARRMGSRSCRSSHPSI